MAQIGLELNQAIAGLSNQDMENLKASVLLQDLLAAVIHLLVIKGVFTYEELAKASQGPALARCLDMLVWLLRNPDKVRPLTEEPEGHMSEPSEEQLTRAFDQDDPDVTIFGG